ncbi:hypothetical protein [Catenulispora pinisilvae]|uniref:hypothetical protein n=1 Tax=Catenulispora pinisilvae TaxID=2705253 RepID=UPI0018913C0B|nr:hypothetical protein [Catenulispora pinisilvae]
MTVIGLTGHQAMPAAASAFAEHELRRLLADQRHLLGVSSLAAGSDQIFARLVLQAGGALHAVIPSRGYEQTFGPEDLARYRELSSAAAETTVLDFDEPGEPAYHAAGLYVVDHCDLLAAVWDGQPARGLGGTGDIVRRARDVGRPVTVIWPEGVRRN